VFFILALACIAEAMQMRAKEIVRGKIGSLHSPILLVGIGTNETRQLLGRSWACFSF